MLSRQEQAMYQQQQQMQMQMQMREQQMREQQMREQQMREQQMREQQMQMRDQQMREQQMREMQRQQQQQQMMAAGRQPHMEQDRGGRPGKGHEQPILPDADIHRVDDYQEELYDDVMERKVQGAKRILRLCTDTENLELLADHETLLGVLSRELKENSKRSFELSVAVVSAFLCFSHFSQFHPVLKQHQCGNAVMKVFEYECDRYQVRKQDIEHRKARFNDLSSAATPEDKKLLAKDEKKYRIQLSRQNKLLQVTVMSLLDVAEEISTERKMVNRRIPLLLVQLLDRNNDELLLVALQFIKKLSVFEENKDAMATTETLQRLVHLASQPNVRIALLALRILYNFSFDEGIRSMLIEQNIVKLLVDLLRNPPFRHVVLRLLYHFSMNEGCRSLLGYHLDGLVMLMQLAVHFPETRVGRDLVALVVNLATHPRTAEVMVRQSELFPHILLRVLKTRDPLLCKVIRHCSSHPNAMELMYELLASESVRMSKWMHEFVRMAPSCVDNPDLLVEILGTLANVTLPNVPWDELCEAGLIDLLTRLLVPGFSEDDIVLECVMLIGNIALHPEAATYVAGSRLPGLMQQILLEKRDDEEIVVQLLYTFRCLMLFDEVREVVLGETELAPCIMRFARATSSAVVDQASQTLQLIADHAGDGGAEWTEQIKAFRFEQHNAEWCRFLARDSAGLSPGGYYYYNESPTGPEHNDDPFASGHQF